MVAGYIPGETATLSLSIYHLVQLGRDAEAFAPLLERAITTLFGGEKQRVALCRALLAALKLLRLDEPLASLDSTLKERLLPYLVRIRAEFTIPIIYVTHSPDEVVALCDEALILRSGKSKNASARRTFSRSAKLRAIG